MVVSYLVKLKARPVYLKLDKYEEKLLNGRINCDFRRRYGELRGEVILLISLKDKIAAQNKFLSLQRSFYGTKSLTSLVVLTSF